MPAVQAEMDDDSMSQGQTCSILAVLQHYGSPETRDEFLGLFYMGDVPEEIPAEDECGFPVQFQMATLLETPPASEGPQ
jgi:hypothetical protein